MPLLTDDQRLVKESAERILLNAPYSASLRHLRNKRELPGYSRELWQSFVEAGIAGVLIPEEFGGVGFGMVEASLVMEALGKALAPSPFFSTSILAVRALDLSGRNNQRALLLSGIAAGKITASLALNETAKYSASLPSTVATHTQSGYALRGVKTYVMDAPSADYFLVSARLPNESLREDSLAIFLVDSKQAGVTVNPVWLVDSHVAGTVELTGCEVPAESVIGSSDHGSDVLDDLVSHGCVALAAELTGIAQECFRLTVDYLKQRRQFGSPIGSFQALQHRAAQLYVDLEICRATVFKAAEAIDRASPERFLLASVAKAKAGATAGLAVQESIQMHGGVGMTDALDFGLFMKRARVLQESYGDANYHLDRVGSLHGY